MPLMLMRHNIDPAEELLHRLGDISEFEVMFGQVLVAIYIRPNTTASGIILTDKTRDEDEWQGKTGLIVKMGPLAYQDSPDVKFYGVRREVGDWIVMRPSDASVPFTLAGKGGDREGVKCRLTQDAHIRMKILSPDTAW